MDKLASLPLLYQPATVWDYGFGLDVLGLTIEQISKQSLGQYLQANLFTPLGMTDTGFLDFAGESGALRQTAADRSRHRQAADPQSGTDATAQFRMCGGCAAPPHRTICASR